MEWEDFNYPKELDGVRFGFTGRNVKVYENGRIFIRFKNTIRERKAENHKGYLRVRVHYKNETKSVSAHRLVANLFVQNPNNKDTVNHIDGDKTNNSASNLEWLTHHENLLHAAFIGMTTLGNKYWCKNNNIKYTEQEIDDIIKRRVAKYRKKERG